MNVKATSMATMAAILAGVLAGCAENGSDVSFEDALSKGGSFAADLDPAATLLWAHASALESTSPEPKEWTFGYLLPTERRQVVVEVSTAGTFGRDPPSVTHLEYAVHIEWPQIRSPVAAASTILQGLGETGKILEYSLIWHQQVPLWRILARLTSGDVPTWTINAIDGTPIEEELFTYSDAHAIADAFARAWAGDAVPVEAYGHELRVDSVAAMRFNFHPVGNVSSSADDLPQDGDLPVWGLLYSSPQNDSVQAFLVYPNGTVTAMGPRAVVSPAGNPIYPANASIAAGNLDSDAVVLFAQPSLAVVAPLAPVTYHLFVQDYPLWVVGLFEGDLQESWYLHAVTGQLLDCARTCRDPITASPSA